jgi:site-specific DNA-methyltransferase (adenine-specific)
MQQQPAGTYDLLLIDPPYHTTNLDFDQEQPMNWATWWPQAWRLLKPTGVVVAFAADLFTVDLIQSQRKHYRYRLVWEKTNYTGFLDASNRPMRGHEDILVFARKFKASTYNPQKAPATSYTSSTTRDGLIKGATHWGEGKGRMSWSDDGTRHPGSVLKFNSVKKNDCIHPTQKPVALLRWLLRSYSNPGDKVLDCFAGSGSTLAACLLERRLGTGVERDKATHARAHARLQRQAAAPEFVFA